VLVLGVVSNKGDVMHLDIFEARLKITTEVHLDVLTTVVKPWMDKVSAGRLYILLQGGTPAQTSHMTLAGAGRISHSAGRSMSGPHSSPDCSPLDYLVWCVAKRDGNRSTHMQN